MTSKLTLYNGGLRLLGERPLASLTESREPRRIMDAAWDGGALDYCLEAGQWKFAMRAVLLDYSPSVDPAFGFQYAFDKPTDHIRLGGVFTDETMTNPLNAYREEGGYWLSDLEPLYLRYVSNDASYGGDMSLWPQTFVKFVESHLASEAALPLTQNKTKMEDMLALRQKRLADALSKDAMQDPTKRPPPGSWQRARLGGTRRDGGSRSEF